MISPTDEQDVARGGSTGDPGGVVDSLSVLMIVLVVAGCAASLRALGATGSPGPRLTADLAPAMLARAGFPATRHNVVALRERLGEAFVAAARELGRDDAVAWDRVAAVAAAARPLEAGADLAGWPQRVLDEIAALDPSVAVQVAHRCPRELLDAVGTGRGVLGGSVFAPLPRDVAVPGPRPADMVAPAPRRAVVPAGQPLGLPLPRAAV